MYTTADTVYDKVGITSSDVNSTQMTRILTQADGEVDRIIKTTCEPKKKIDLFAGSDRNIYYSEKFPLLSLLKVEIDGTNISLDKIWKRDSGHIQLLNGADKIFFYASTTKPNCFIKYYYGWLEPTTTQTEIATAVTAGDATDIVVDDGSDFETNDWVELVGFDGNKEFAKLTGVSGDTLTCDLVQDHEVDTIVTKCQVPQIVQNLSATIAAIMTALYMVGSTYTFATSYTIPDYSVSKGVPYPHFNTNLQAWVKERDFLISQMPGWIVFA